VNLPSRSFVKYRNDESLPEDLQIEIFRMSENAAEASVIIPTMARGREQHLRRLLQELKLQVCQNLEIIVVKGDHRQGRAINCGADLASADVLVTLDDDSRLRHPDTLKNLIEALKSDISIGAVGGSNLVDPDANWLVQRVMRELPRRSSPPVETLTDSDMAEHPCLAMSIAAYKAIGGENELIPRGLDPYLRQAFRDAGYRVTVAPDVLYSHLPPDTLGKLVRQFFRNGAQSRYCSVRFPQWVYDTVDIHGTSDSPRTPLWRRTARFAQETVQAILNGKWIYVLCQLSYALGWLKEATVSFRASRRR
jgi:cellulose synthase/poly-beta-1,6-N-acetylglucosamine synthase-like glycosyltransferase